MKKGKLRKISMFFLSSLLVILCGCQTKPSSSSNTSSSSYTSSSSETSSDYYNEDNFVEGDRVVRETKLVTYDGPSLLTSSTRCSVKVNEHDLFVYETRINQKRKFSYEYSKDTTAAVIFDFDGKVHIEIDIKEDVTVESAVVRPLVYGITPLISDNKISFDLTYTGNYVVEYNDNQATAINIFANPLETNPITAEQAKNDDSIVYIGPGIYEAKAIPTKSNSTIYLAGGAYVYGQIRAENVENLTIRGRGIISGSIYDRLSESQYTLPVEIRYSRNVKIEDLCFFDPAGWTITLYKSSEVEINNIKIITARANGDGISVQSCEDVQVNGGFVRTWDDSLVVKNSDRGTTKNITFDNVVVWTDLAQSMEVGYETYGATMDQITFQNIIVLHNFHKPAMSIHNCDDAVITNVSFKNITIEDGQMLGDVRDDGENDFLIDMTIAYNIDWTKSAGIRGNIDGVTFDNIKVYELAPSCITRMNGESNDSMIKNVTISNVEINGKSITSAADLKLTSNSYTQNINVTKGTANVLGAIIKLPYKLNLSTNEVNYSNVSTPSQEGLLVPSFALGTGQLNYVGVAAKGDYSATATHGAGNKTSTSADDGSGDFTAAGYNASSVVDGNNTTTWKSADWKNEEDEFAALTIDFADEVKTVGLIRIIGNTDNEFYYTYQIQVWGRKLKTDGTVNPNYTRIQSSKTYELTPSSNNCIDINVTTQGYAGLQLRLYKGSLFTACKNYEISEIEFYPPSLTFGKAIVDATDNADVYNVEKVVDGETTGTSYYESASLPAHIVIDLQNVYSVSCIVFALPPSLLWEARTQNIEILMSDSPTNYDKNTIVFTEVKAATDYTFDPVDGNRVMVEFEPTQARFIKVVINSNSNGGYGAQLSEISAYGA